MRQGWDIPCLHQGAGSPGVPLDGLPGVVMQSVHACCVFLLSAGKSPVPSAFPAGAVRQCAAGTLLHAGPRDPGSWGSGRGPSPASYVLSVFRQRGGFGEWTGERGGGEKGGGEKGRRGERTRKKESE